MLLGLPVAEHFDGRVLTETFLDGPAPTDVAAMTGTKTSANAAGSQTRLMVSQVGHARYIDQAWIA